MPNFPTYNGELPSCLNPFNLRHWLLLAYWVYFRPTALKCYLYRADSELYRAGAGWKIFRTWNTPAYRNIFLIIPATCLLLSIPLGLLFQKIGLLSGILLQKTNFSPTHYLIGLLVGITIGLGFGALFGMILGLSVGVARGTVVGIITAVAMSVGHGTVISGLFSIALDLEKSQISGTLAIGGALGIAVGVIVSFGISAVVEGAVGIAIGVMFGAAVGIMGSLSFSVLSMSSLSIDNNPPYLVFMATLGLTMMGALGPGLSFTESVVILLVLSTTVSLVIGIKNGQPTSGAIAFFLGISLAWHIPIYLLEFFLSLVSPNRNILTLLEWDEIQIFPLPKMQQASLQLLKFNKLKGLRLLSYLACNPFQRWSVQRVLKAYLREQAEPLHFIYHDVLNSEITNTYVWTPVTEQGWNYLPKVEKLLLGEISCQWVDCTADPFNQQLEQLVYKLTWFWRDHSETLLTRFVRLLYQLLDQEIIDPKFNLSNYQDAYTGLSNYPGGFEIECSFELMASFLICKQVSDLPTKISAVSDLPPLETAFRPKVVQALSDLKKVGEEIATYTTATTYTNQQSAFLRANELLNSLDRYVSEEVQTPERAIIKRIIREWQKLVSEAGGELARRKLLSPVPNPYVAGSPVIGYLFVGREDIMRRLEELWISPGQVSSVILYGHRRMGKSSILKNLGTRFGTQTVIVDFNMQIAVTVASTSELLYYLALEVYDSLSFTQKQALGEPQEHKFTTENPYYAFKRFLAQLDNVRDGQRLIIAVDEYELLEQLITKKPAEQKLIGFWRGLLETYPWFIAIFAGLHRLNEMRHDYWNPLFGSVTAILVSFLSRETTRKLITQPSPDFDIDYDHEAVERIIELTNGQPYLTQLICRELVTNFNRQFFEEGREQEKRFTVEDVEEIINAPDFYSDGNAYFTGIWMQAAKSPPPRQQEILRKLCREELSQEQLAEKTTLSLTEVEAALKTLLEHDVIRERNGSYGYTVELMRRWVEALRGG